MLHDNYGLDRLIAVFLVTKGRNFHVMSVPNGERLKIEERGAGNMWRISSVLFQ